MKNTKKTLVRVLSVCMALITMLLASVMPVSATEYRFYEESVKDTIGTELVCKYSVAYTPGTSPSTSTFESVNGGAVLRVGSTVPTTETVYMVVLSGAYYDGDSTIQFERGWKQIRQMKANLTYNSVTTPRGGSFNYFIEETRRAKFFHSWNMLSKTEFYEMDKCVNGLYNEARLLPYDVFYGT